uniref:Uncharacterized protein n=1 Tax=viral metagenome TaxID=1070528 RepID=A0A6M3IM91_9ZZZZ
MAKKGSVKDMAATLPERQANAEKRYKREATEFYGEMEENGINTSKENVENIEPTPLIAQLAGQIISYKRKR